MPGELPCAALTPPICFNSCTALRMRVQVWFDPLTRRKFYSENTYLAFARWVLGLRYRQSTVPGSANLGSSFTQHAAEFLARCARAALRVSQLTGFQAPLSALASRQPSKFWFLSTLHAAPRSIRSWFARAASRRPLPLSRCARWRRRSSRSSRSRNSSRRPGLQ